MENALNIKEFTVGEVLYESKNSKIFTATHAENSQNVVIKQLNKQYPTAEDLEQFIQEYEVAKSLESIDGVGNYKLAQNGSSLYLIMDEFEGQSLTTFINENKFQLELALDIAIKITSILNEIHQKNIIHKDINPSNIIWNNKTNNIRIIDFGISCHLSQDINEIMTSKHFDGTLQYISPEQTGRMEMAVDYRSDLYSLGITLYQLFTRHLPFFGNDAIELVHCHIAKTPEPPHNIYSIPKVLSNIVMKLLAKNPDERYQSAKGLKADLEHCLYKYKTTGKIEDFETGLHDFSGKFQIAHKIHGREQELKVLLDAFSRIRKGKNELVLVTGYSGIGKSLLINEMYRPVLQKNGLFIKGQFNRFKKDVPLNAFTQAFNELIIEILSGTEANLTTWKQEFLKTLGPNGKIITNIIPEMEQIIGKQPELQELNPIEAQNRFLMIFRNFVKVIAKKQHPLVLFLDNIQWCDPLSMQLIKDLGINKIPYLMLICAFRNNETHEGHLVNLTFNEIAKNRNYEKLQITNLSLESVKQLVKESLHCNINDTEELSKILLTKTNGNPFFIKELLKTFYKENLLNFNFNKNKWEWELDKIKNAHISDNLFEIIKERIQKLPGECIHALKVAACIGSNFDLQTTSALLNKTISEVSGFLLNALDEGIIYAHGNRLKILPNHEDVSINVSYKFQHYRIQQIVHALIEDTRLNEIHSQIGKYLLKTLPDDIIDERLIEIANHINYSLDFVNNPEERIEFAEINLRAAKKATASSAYSSAFNFFEKGISLLSQSSWNERYNLTLDLHRGYAESAYQVGQYDDAEKYIDIILNNVQSKLDKVSAIAMRLRQYATMSKPDEAITEGIKALALLGIKLSSKPGISKVFTEIALAKWRKGSRKISDLINLPVLHDPEKKMAARLLTEMGAPAYTLGNDNLYSILALKVVNLSFKYGYTPELPYALVAYGMLQSIAFGNLKAGNELGKLAIELNEKHNDLEYRCRVLAAYGVLTHHWNNHWSTLTHWFRKGIEAGIHSGDIFYLGHSASNCIIWDPKLNLQTKIEEHLKFMVLIRETGFSDAIDTSEMRLQLLRNLRGETTDRYSMTDKHFDETTRLKEMTERKYVSGIAMYHLAKAEIYLTYGKPLNAFSHIEEVDKLVKSLVGLNYTFILSVIAFHAASQLYNAADSNKSEKKYLRRMEKELKQMKKWAAHNSTNYLHHLQIMQAELFKHKGNFNQAAFLYEKAIENANKNFWLKDEAFFHEVTARFFTEQNLNKASSSYIKQASYLYNRLGAIAKVIQLAEHFPELTEQQQPSNVYNENNFSVVKKTSVSTTRKSADFLDMNTITKASQAISGEIVLETLLKKLMQITVENAGAQRGVLLLIQNNKLYIQAENSIDTNEIKVLQSISLQDCSCLPHSVINYVTNSKKSVVLSDALYEGKFTQDPYILSKKPKSILVEPIIKLNNLQGIIYLENNLNVGVFSEKRQQMLNILSSQIAISIENSKLYESLEEKIKERTIELVEANKQLSGKNNQIQEQKEELEKLNASKDKMFSIIAHDLKGPFGAILGLTQLILSNLSEYNKQEIENIILDLYQSELKVYTLLENLLNWAMSQTGKIVFNPRPIFLKNIVDEVIDVLEENSKAKNLNIIAEVDDSLVTYADKHMIYTVLRNLVSNAIKYCYKDGNIKILVNSDSGSTYVSVIDDGIGIPKDKIEKLFKISRDVSTAGTNNEKGTGLGLIICKEFIEKHGGKIWVEGQPGNGCKFQFSLPVYEENKILTKLNR